MKNKNITGALEKFILVSLPLVDSTSNVNIREKTELYLEISWND